MRKVKASRLARGLARHWGIAVLLVCGAVLRWAAMAAYWPALVYIDTPRYLGNYSVGVDPVGYHYLLVKPLLLLHAGLAGVAVAQHLLGLALGLSLYALAFRYGAPRWLSALAAVPVLFDSYQVQAEQMIMSDVLFETLLAAALLVLAWPRSRVSRDTSRADLDGDAPRSRIWIRIGAAAVFLGLATTVRQVGEVAAIPLAGYALIAVRPAAAGRMRAAAVRARAAVVAVVLFAVPVLGYMTFSATVLGAGFRLSEMNNQYLYARTADAADCVTLRIPASERSLCPGKENPGIDNLANNGFTSPLYLYKPPTGQTRRAAVSTFEHAVLTQQPLRVAGDVIGDAAKVFALTRDGSPGDPPLDRWQFQTSYPVFQPAYRIVFSGTSLPHINRPLAADLRWYQLHGGYTPGPLLLVFGVTALAGAFCRRASRPLRAGAAAGAALALAVVGGGDLYEFSWRYQLPLLVTLVPAGVLGALAVGRGLARRDPGQPGPGTMNRCTPNRLTPSLRSGHSPAASCTPTPGSGSEETRSSGVTDPGEPTLSSSGTTSP